MRGRWIVWSALVLGAASCAMDPERDVMPSVVGQEQTIDKNAVLSLAPPPALDDDWSRWLVGEWGSVAESDLPGFPAWVKGTGRVTVELGVGGQFLVVTKEGQVAQLSDEYVRHLRQDMHAPEAEVEKLRSMRFAAVEFFTTDPQTAGITAYLFDSWRCVAVGTGRREGNTEVVEWRWSVSGRGTSTRTTKRMSEDHLVITEKYTWPDGGAMEDRVKMIRKR